MTFDWSTYLVVARRLLSAPFATEHREAAFRSSISRAYYAAFCTARDHVRRAIPVPQTGHAHAVVWSYFRKQADRRAQTVARKGVRLKAHRRKADYEDEVVGLPALAEEDILLSEEIIDAIGRL